MIVTMYTVTDEDEICWIDCYIDDNKIIAGYRIPAHIDRELNLIVFTDELNLFIGGGQITVKATTALVDILEKRFN